MKETNKLLYQNLLRQMVESFKGDGMTALMKDTENLVKMQQDKEATRTV